MRAIIEQVEIMKGKMISPSLNFKELVSDDEKEKSYWKPEQPPPRTEILKKELTSFFSKILILSDASWDNLKSLSTILFLFSIKIV